MWATVVVFGCVWRAAMECGELQWTVEVAVKEVALGLREREDGDPEDTCTS